jgi:hypothetical protein
MGGMPIKGYSIHTEPSSIDEERGCKSGADLEFEKEG